MLRLSLALAALVVLAGCETFPAALRPITERRTDPPAASAQATGPTPISRPIPANEQLLDLERRLSAAAQDQGLGGALGPILDPTDGFILRPGVLYQGGGVETGLNAAQTGPIMWQPDRVFTSDEGDMGMTSGRYVQVVPGREAIQGRYIAVWRKDSNGEWRLLTETRVPDPPRAPPAPAPRRR